MDDNQFYSFARCALISYFTKCIDNSYQSYFRAFIDGVTLDSYLDKLEEVFKFYMKGKV